MANITNPNNNANKQNQILDIYYKACNLEDPEKVNLVRNKQLEKASLAGKREYIELTTKKDIPLVFEHSIKIKEDTDLHIVPISNCHFFDLSNPQKGIDNFTNFVALKESLRDKAPKDKNIIFVNGGMAGSGYDIKNFNTAAIKNGKILAWGLDLIETETAKMIAYAAYYGDDPYIFLQYGREERKVTDKLNVLFYDRVIKKLNKNTLWKSIKKKPKIFIVPGTKRVYNVEKKLKNGEIAYFDISNHTNVLTTSNTVSGNLSAARRQHGEIVSADIQIVQTENVPFAIANDDARLVLCGGQSSYRRASKGNVPLFTSDGQTAFSILLGNNSHEAEIIRSKNIVNDRTFFLERKNALEDNKIRLLCELCEKALKEKCNNFYQNVLNFDYKTSVSKIEKGEENEK